MKLSQFINRLDEILATDGDHEIAFKFTNEFSWYFDLADSVPDIEYDYKDKSIVFYFDGVEAFAEIEEITREQVRKEIS